MNARSVMAAAEKFGSRQDRAVFIDSIDDCEFKETCLPPGFSPNTIIPGARIAIVIRSGDRGGRSGGRSCQASFWYRIDSGGRRQAAESMWDSKVLVRSFAFQCLISDVISVFLLNEKCHGVRCSRRHVAGVLSRTNTMGSNQMRPAAIPCSRVDQPPFRQQGDDPVGACNLSRTRSAAPHGELCGSCWGTES
jgi:hypothetical protein